MYGRALQCRAARIKSNAQHIHIISPRTDLYEKSNGRRGEVWILGRHSTRKSSRSAYVSEPSSSASQSSMTLFRLLSRLEDADDEFDFEFDFLALALLPLPLPLSRFKREDLLPAVAALRIET
jgi:hypothetical protein